MEPPPIAIVSTLLKAVLLPPSGPLLICSIGLLSLACRCQRIGLTLLFAGIVLSYLFSIPLAATLLSRLLQSHPPLPEQIPLEGSAGVIVVLGGGLHKNAPEYGGPTLHARTLGRVRYAARLARQTGLPILASGGHTDADAVANISEAEVMREVLENEFGVGSVLIETASRDTWENAVNSAALLRERHIDTILLVTNAVHLPRAVAAFEAQGLKVIPAPTLFFDAQSNPTNLQSWLPSVSAMQEIRYACYEWLGRFWYAVRHQTTP